MRRDLAVLTCILCIFAPFSLSGEQPYAPNPLDLSTLIKSPKLESELHRPLTEHYIWDLPGLWPPAPAAAPHWVYFRKGFVLSAAPATATLYVAGPEGIRVYLNGQLLANAQQDARTKIHPEVFAFEVARALRSERNELALAAYGQRVVVKIVPQPLGVNAIALMMSTGDWKFSTQTPEAWSQPGFDDSGWKNVADLGRIEDHIDSIQFNQDAGMYRWPGYDGISPFLVRAPVRAAAALEIFPGLGAFHNASSLAAGSDQLNSSARVEFTVDLPPQTALRTEYPSLVLDFARELTGRLEVISDSDSPTRIVLQYGESLGEATEEPYLGEDELDIPARATVYGPKSAFRYVKVRFLAGASPLRFKSIQLDYTYYPVQYKGSFESSDPLIKRIWEVGAYTSHLCMDDDIWDAPKRDRARWMGDLDVSGHVIDAVFADRFLMQKTMDDLIRDAGQPVERDVNTIPGYSAFWVMGEADYYRHMGDLNYLRSMHRPLVELLDYMASELDEQSIFTNRRHAVLPFVDWSPGLDSCPTWLGVKPGPIEELPDNQRATQLEFYGAFHQGAWLLRQLGETTEAELVEARAAAIRDAALKYLLDRESGTFGDRWQPNAMAVYSGLADAVETQMIWQKVLSHPDKFRITPYYNFYVISAMAAAGRYKDALDWVREYWGGMVQRGATSFWEAYYPRLPQEGYHRALRADFGMGYFVSLAHGWASGPTVWLTEEILGIKPRAPGFTQVSIRPELAGLTWARGAEPTPRGLINVSYHQDSDGRFVATVDLPRDTEAAVSMPIVAGETEVQVDNFRHAGELSENGRRIIVHLTHAGHFTVTSKAE